MDLTRAMPYAPDAEDAVLIHCLSHPDAAAEVLQLLPDAAFYHPGNRTLYECLGRMEGDGTPIAYLAAAHWITEKGLMDKIGGQGRLAELATGFISNFPHYAGIMLDKWKAREVITMCTGAITQAYAQPADGNIDEWLGTLTERILALSVDRQQKRERPFTKLVDAALDRYEENIKRGGVLAGISTGFPGLDHVTGGKQPGQLWVIGGGTSDGKSAYAQQTALYMAGNGTPVALYTLEMPDDEVMDRFFSMHSGVDSALFKRGLTRRDHLDSCRKSSDELRGLPVTVRDVSGIKLSPLIADMRLLAKRGVKHFVVDYGQLIENEGRSRSREEEVAKVSRNMKATAKQLRVSIDLLSQLNDDGKLRESRAIGFDADVVATLSCPIKKEKQGDDWIEVRQEDKRILFLGKNRNGKRNISFNLKFQGEIFTFTEEAKP